MRGGGEGYIRREERARERECKGEQCSHKSGLHNDAAGHTITDLYMVMVDFAFTGKFSLIVKWRGGENVGKGRRVWEGERGRRGG